jgi:DNA (cytosine-5)-methyltransferase 1
MLSYGSLFSGIGTDHLAWAPLGMTCRWTAEVDPFACEVLAQRGPAVPNLGDVTAANFVRRARRLGRVEVLVGGPPCQSFSQSGRRGGLRGEGRLLLRMVELVHELKPEWFVLENVRGLLSADQGRAFGTLLGEVARGGYGWAYRVLNSEWFGTPQRRRRVYLVGRAGGRCPGAVLLDQGLSSGSPGTHEEGGDCDSPPPLPRPHQSSTRHGQRRRLTHAYQIQFTPLTAIVRPTTVSAPLLAQHQRVGLNREASTLIVCPNRTTPGTTVRKLTPLEAERLMGLPDHHTQIEYRGQPAAKTVRYRAIGLAMTVPVLRWVGERLLKQHSLKQHSLKTSNQL